MISPTDAAAILAAAWLLAQGRRLHGWWIAGLLLLILLVTSVVLPDQRGLRARYYPNTAFEGPFERSTEYDGRQPASGEGFTRVDRRIDFTPAEFEIPLPWINDVGRFNFQGPNEPRRSQLPFSTEWSGFWWVESNGEVLGLYMDAPGATGQLVLDGVTVLTMGPTDMTAAASVEPLRGWHQLIVRLSAPPAATRRFSTGQLIANQRVPFDAVTVAQRRLAPWQRTALRARDRIAGAMALGVLAWLGVLVVFALAEIRLDYFAASTEASRRRAAVRVFALVAIAEACWFAWPWASRLMVLVGGDDTLTYETYARHIQLDGLLMPGLLEPFYYQAFYPYFLAALHAVFGESMFGPILVQRLLVALVAWAIMAIAVRVSREDAWRVALVTGVIFAYAKVGPISAKLLNESLFVPLLAAWTIMLVRVSRAPGTAGAGRTGLVGGLTALTRTTALLALVMVIPALWHSWKGVINRSRLLLTVVGCLVLVVSLISIRNALVVHAFVPLPGEFAVTLLAGNQPPPEVRIDLTRRAPLYNALHVHEFTRTVIEYAITAPAEFAANMGRKALFALGYYEPYAPGFGVSLVFMAVSIAGFAGLWLAVRSGTVPTSVALVPALVAFSQFAAVVLVYPKGERLILPFQALMATYAAVAFDRMVRRF